MDDIVLQVEPPKCQRIVEFTMDIFSRRSHELNCLFRISEKDNLEFILYIMTRQRIEEFKVLNMLNLYQIDEHYLEDEPTVKIILPPITQEISDFLEGKIAKIFGLISTINKNIREIFINYNLDVKHDYLYHRYGTFDNGVNQQINVFMHHTRGLIHKMKKEFVSRSDISYYKYIIKNNTSSNNNQVKCNDKNRSTNNSSNYQSPSSSNYQSTNNTNKIVSKTNYQSTNKNLSNSNYQSTSNNNKNQSTNNYESTSNDNKNQSTNNYESTSNSNNPHMTPYHYNTSNEYSSINNSSQSANTNIRPIPPFNPYVCDPKLNKSINDRIYQSSVNSKLLPLLPMSCYQLPPLDQNPEDETENLNTPVFSTKK